MKPTPMLSVLTDRKGTILGASVLASRPPRGRQAVHTRVLPLEGQTVAEVPVPNEIGTLATAEDFRRLCLECYLPRGGRELKRKHGQRRSTKRPAS